MTAAEVLTDMMQHKIDDPDFTAVAAPVVIEDYVYIGPRAIILPGVKICCGAVIAAGAVVTHNVEGLNMVAGARVCCP